MSLEPRAAPLDGVKVLDFGTALLGPFTATQLGMLGADVVRVEPPDGDIVMHIGTTIGGMGSWYISSNFNKRALVLGLGKEDERQIAFDLIRWADVVVEN